MAKIAEILLNRNSLRERFSSVNPVNTGGIFKQTEKGNAIYLSNAASLDGYGAILGVKTIVFAIKPTGTAYLCLNNGKDQFSIGIGDLYSGKSLTNNYVYIDSEQQTYNATYNRYQLVIAEFSGGIDFSTDFEIYPGLGLSPYHLAYKIILFDHILSAQERNEIYTDYLASTPLAATKRNFYYPKPTDLSNENGLVAAYNMIPQSGELVDISGNGKTGILNGNPLQTKEGMYFDGVDDYIQTLVNPHTDLTGSDFTFHFNLDINSLSPFDLIGLVTAYPRFYIRWTGSQLRIAVGNAYNDFASGLVLGKQILTVAFEYSTGTLKYYINGVLKGTDINLSYKDSLRNGNMIIGGTSGNYNGQIDDFKLYNVLLSEQEIKDYHNQYASQVSFIDDFKYEPADGTNILPKGWIPGTGSFKISELTTDDNVLSHLKKGTKVLQRTTSRAIACPTTQNYGTWEFNIRKNTLGSLCGISLCNNDKGGYSEPNGGNKYALLFWSNGIVYFGRQSAGESSVSIIFQTGSGFLEAETNYTFKITRDSAGEFTVYLKGGSFGNNYVLLGPLVAGSNPVIDNTYKDGKYFTFQSTDNDQITNIKFTKGIIQ